jgi:hypothetical protein
MQLAAQRAAEEKRQAQLRAEQCTLLCVLSYRSTICTYFLIVDD